MKKTYERIYTIQILYNLDLCSVDIYDSINKIDNEYIINEISKLDEMKLLPEDVNIDINSVIELFNLVKDNINKIDDIISNSLQSYKLSRLNVVDRQIIRVATAELISGIDKRIIINEALNITKAMSDEGNHKAVSFNNKLLDNISKNI